MTDAPFPPGVVARLGTSAFRLPGRYGTVFLMPPDYRTYVAADAAAQVYREYDLTTGQPVRVMLGPDLYGEVSRPSANGTRMAVATPAGLWVVDLTNGQIVFAVPPGPEVARFELAPTGDRLAVQYRNPDTSQREADGDMEDVYIRSIAIHDLGTGGAVREIRPLVNFNVSTLFSGDGRFLATAGVWHNEFDDQPCPLPDGPPPIQIWDAETGAEVARITPPTAEDSPYGQVGAYPIAAAGEYLLLGSTHFSLPVALNKFATGELVCAYRTDDPPGYQQGQYALSPDARVLACHASMGQVIRRDARTGVLLDATPCPFPISDRPYPIDLAVLPDGSVLALRVDNQAVRVWTAPEGRPLTRGIGGTSAITAIQYAAGGKEIRTAGRGEAIVRRWDAITGELLGETHLPDEVADYCKGLIWFGPDDRCLVYSRGGSAVFNLASGETRFTPPVPESATLGESLSADGWRVSLQTHYLNEGDVGVRVENILEGSSRIIHRIDSTSAAASYDRGRVVLMYDDRLGKHRTVTCLGVDSWRSDVIWSRTMPIGPGYQKSYRSGIDYSRVSFTIPSSAIVWATDGATVLAIPAKERVPFLIDPVNGETIATWTTPIGWTHAVHPLRPILATATAEGEGLILADWRTGARLAVLSEQCYPHALAWSPDGTRLVASGSDGMAWVFDTSSILNLG